MEDLEAVLQQQMLEISTIKAKTGRTFIKKREAEAIRRDMNAPSEVRSGGILFAVMCLPIKTRANGCRRNV